MGQKSTVSNPDAAFIELEEDGVRISLTIVDTPGFGDNIDNEFTSVSRTTNLSSIWLTNFLW